MPMSQRLLWLAAIGHVIALASCAIQREATRQDPTPTVVTTEVTATVADTPSPTAAADPFAAVRANRHLLLFHGVQDVNGSAPNRAIYCYDYESGSVSFVFSLAEGEASSPDVYVSPDALHLLLASYGTVDDPTEALVQVDLARGGVTRIDLYRGTEWLVPVVPGRRPGEEYENEVLHGPLESSIFELSRVAWAPDSDAFAFTLGTPGGSIDRHNNSQLYLVAWGTGEVIPLATDIPGNNVGLGSEWSPNGRYMSFIQQWEEDVWVIDLDAPSSGMLVVSDAYSPQVEWLPDGSTLMISDWDQLVTFSIPALDMRTLLDPPYVPGEFVTYYLLGPTIDGTGMVVLERVEDIRGEYEPGSQRLLHVVLSTGQVLPVVVGDPFVAALKFPERDWLWLLYDNPPRGAIVTLPGGEGVVDPSSRLRLPYEELVRQFSEESYMVGLTSDMHLAALERNGRLMIWDVLTGGYTEVAPDLEGEKTFIGWIPDPDAWEAALQAGAP